jgi:hypothetical protein
MLQPVSTITFVYSFIEDKRLLGVAFLRSIIIYSANNDTGNPALLVTASSTNHNWCCFPEHSVHSLKSTHKFWAQGQTET